MNDSEIELLAKGLSKKRYEHTKAVSELAAKLAKHYGVSIDDAYKSAMLHDITKEYTLKQQLQILKKSDIMTDIANINLLHSITAYILLQNSGLNDDILNAIRYHTTMRPKASVLEKIIYIADACSYDRTYSQAEDIRKLAFDDLDEAILMIIEFNVCSIINKRQVISTLSIECYNEIIKEKNNENQR